MAWFRVDNRLVHGQVIEAWMPYLDASALVVANDTLAEDEIQQQIMQLAIPDRIHVFFIHVSDAKALYDKLEKKGRVSLFLLCTCQDAKRVVEQGVNIAVLNIGNMHYARGKKQMCTHVAASDDDLICFDALRSKGIQLDFRCVPSDTPIVEEWHDGCA